MEYKVKEIIDWKAFNFLLDMFTKYEDAGYIIELNVTVNINNGTIYWYDTNRGVFPVKTKIWTAKAEAYEKEGVYYKIICKDSRNTYNYEFIKEFYDLVSDKFDKQETKAWEILSLKVKNI